MRDYDTPRIPPATPPAIDPNADPVSARELAEDDGDSDAEGTTLADPPASEIDKERSEALAELDKRDGAGERELDSMTPETLLPPD
ncbi:hypothetical protein [Erythrobacter sp. HKB08]|uniref:hypothetical protein n=1 Tax=Erythrobacter sp. HKB08 TaxID=2502843 RepID=UPI001008FD1E|nr:hypothetical protein [Erythrobacter sp. HKB08]